MKFYSRIPFNGKNLVDQDISISQFTYVESDDKYLLWNKIPFCSIDSQIAKDYFIWADDGNEKARTEYENIILFNYRLRTWTEKIPVYDEEGHIIDYKTVTREGRYTPEEIDFILANFSQFFNDPGVIHYNSYFYRGSDIEEVRVLANYLIR